VHASRVTTHYISDFLSSNLVDCYQIEATRLNSPTPTNRRRLRALLFALAPAVATGPEYEVAAGLVGLVNSPPPELEHVGQITGRLLGQEE
jgi:hypothetical protein